MCNGGFQVNEGKIMREGFREINEAGMKRIEKVSEESCTIFLKIYSFRTFFFSVLYSDESFPREFGA